MTTFNTADTLHRLIKESLDSGAASSLAEATAMFRGYHLGFVIGDDQARDPCHQAALLTGVVLARRVFLGGVFVLGDLEVPLMSQMQLGATLREAVATLGGIAGDIPPGSPLISIGGEPSQRKEGFHVRTEYAGWRCGIVPAHERIRLCGRRAIPLGPMLAAALAVNEAFLFTRGGGDAIGYRPIGLSLWQLSPDVDWLSDSSDGPELLYLPSRLWLIGLGHLGQAYLWGLGLLPYPEPSRLSLVLQDIDVISPSTESTSILSDANLIGQKKTRAMAAWAERRGFTTVIYERLFSADFHRQPDEPAIALCGLDNALGRQALDQVGFDLVVEAGLGQDHRNFRTMRLHTLPGSRAAADIWRTKVNNDEVVSRPAYQKMLREGDLDQCGITLLAGKAVGAPFVGAIAASIALSELLRLLHGGPLHLLVDLDLEAIEHRSTIPHTQDFSRLNPGYVTASN